MTIAARADSGRFVVSHGATTSSAAIVKAPTTPASWVLAPAFTATGVREALALTEKPPNRPAPMLADPSASSSWFWSIRWPLRPAKVRDRTLVSAIEITAIATPPASIAWTSASDTRGTWKLGSPGGNGPTTGTPALAARPSAAVSAVAPRAAMRIPGTCGRQRRQARMTAIDPRPSASAVGFVRPSVTPLPKAIASAGTPSPSALKPKSLGSCPTKIVSASPFSVPIRIGLDSSSVRMPSRRTPNAMHSVPETSARPAARSPARAGSPSMRGAIVAAMIGASDESGPSTRTGLGPRTA